MHWTTLVQLAKKAEDLTEEEWCGMYVSVKNPTFGQRDKATAVAKEVAIRNRMLGPDLEIFMEGWR